jgi:hypothetical protein
MVSGDVGVAIKETGPFTSVSSSAEVLIGVVSGDPRALCKGLANISFGVLGGITCCEMSDMGEVIPSTSSL